MKGCNVYSALIKNINRFEMGRVVQDLYLSRFI